MSKERFKGYTNQKFSGKLLRKDAKGEVIGGFHDKIDFRHAIGDLYQDKLVRASLHGEQHVQAVRDLRSSKRNLIMIGNHRSNADAPVLEHTLERYGYPDISEDLVFLLGQRLKQKMGSGYFSMAYPHIDVWPPTIEVKTEEDQHRAFVMTRNTRKAVNQAYEEGKIIVAFGEGTRTRDGDLGPFMSQIGHYAKDGAHVVPFALMGTEQIWPVDKKAPYFTERNSAHLIIGEPFEAVQFMQGHGQERYQSVMEYTRERVQELLDNHSDLEQRR